MLDPKQLDNIETLARLDLEAFTTSHPHRDPLASTTLLPTSLVADLVTMARRVYQQPEISVQPAGVWTNDSESTVAYEDDRRVDEPGWRQLFDIVVTWPS